MNAETIYLEFPQAIEAVCHDLRHYEPQVLLMCEIVQVLGGVDVGVKIDRAAGGVWLSEGRRQRPQRLSEGELVEHVCNRLCTAAPDPATLSGIVSRVFQTKVRLSPETPGRPPGLLVETGIADFTCRQCGQCCRDLDYRHEVTTADVQRWEEAGRSDILKWVGTARATDGGQAYQIWIVPGTNRFAEQCPFLQPEPDTERWCCRIHDVKPAICRNYPVSRKHGLMTGCRGFDQV